MKNVRNISTYVWLIAKFPLTSSGISILYLEIYAYFIVHSSLASYIDNTNKFQLFSVMWFSWDGDNCENGSPWDGIKVWDKIIYILHNSV